MLFIVITQWFSCIYSWLSFKFSSWQLIFRYARILWNLLLFCLSCFLWIVFLYLFFLSAKRCLISFFLNDKFRSIVFDNYFNKPLIDKSLRLNEFFKPKRMSSIVFVTWYTILFFCVLTYLFLPILQKIGFHKAMFYP